DVLSAGRRSGRIACRGKPERVSRKNMSDKKSAIDPDLVRELASIVNESGLSETEVEHGELRLRIARTLTAAPVTHMVQTAPAPVAAAAHAPAPAPTAQAAPAAEDLSKHPGVVPSPMVGTAYLAPEPGAPTFVKMGDAVTAGQ